MVKDYMEAGSLLLRFLVVDRQQEEEDSSLVFRDISDPVVLNK